MLDEEQVNKKIQEAADSYQPAYDDKAWKEMERLLDEHLPQKKDKRRIIFSLLLLLIPAAVIYFGIQYKNAGHTLNSRNTAPISKSDLSTDNASKKVVYPNPIDKISPGTVQYNRSNGSLPGKKPTLAAELFFDESNHDKSTKNIVTNVEPGRSNRDAEKPNDPSTGNAMLNATGDVETHTDSDVASGNEMIENKDVANADSLNKNAGTKKKMPVTHHFAQSFSIGIAAGPDVSAVELNNTGKVTLIKGVQASYRLSGKFTLRSGFFIAKKIYSVNGDEYHSQQYNPANYYLQTVGANCKVYEVPLTLSYNFSKSKKHQWFVSAGLSSYFMKKESYEYFYKYPSGLTDTKYYSVSNKNQYYFSVLDLSASYEYVINKKISLTAEPYVKLPVTGIGVGKIKLNSGGVLFSLNVKPF